MKKDARIRNYIIDGVHMESGVGFDHALMCVSWLQAQPRRR